MKTGIELIEEERKRQIEKKGYSHERDSHYTGGELARAAVSYALPPGFHPPHTLLCRGVFWPWKAEYWKPKVNRIRELQKAGALIAAEIDRIQRIKAQEEVNKNENNN